tara:strand:+ start:40 stop:381 length:342 start_codon:yes stop_codon:yes gene_type:complete
MESNIAFGTADEVNSYINSDSSYIEINDVRGTTINATVISSILDKCSANMEFTNDIIIAGTTSEVIDLLSRSKINSFTMSVVLSDAPTDSEIDTIFSNITGTLESTLGQHSKY